MLKPSHYIANEEETNTTSLVIVDHKIAIESKLKGKSQYLFVVGRNIAKKKFYSELTLSCEMERLLRDARNNPNLTFVLPFQENVRIASKKPVAFARMLNGLLIPKNIRMSAHFYDLCRNNGVIFE